jgi:hypothetical protein
VKTSNLTGINEFKSTYKPRSNLPKDEGGDLLVDSLNNLNRQKNCFCQFLNVHNVSDVRQMEVHTAEPLVLGPSCHEVEIAYCKVEEM